MGINIFESRTDKYDRNIYYKRQYVDNMKLFKGAVAQGVFYSTDKIPLQKKAISTYKCFFMHLLYLVGLNR